MFHLEVLQGQASPGSCWRRHEEHIHRAWVAFNTTWLKTDSRNSVLVFHYLNPQELLSLGQALLAMAPGFAPLLLAKQRRLTQHW